MRLFSKRAFSQGFYSGSSQGVTSRSGFTMLELLIVVVIMGIFSTIAIPRGLEFMRHMKLLGATDGLKRQLQLARMKALADPYKHCGVYFKVSPLDSQYTQIFLDVGANKHKFDDPRAGGNDAVYLGKQPVEKGVVMSFTNAPPNDVLVFRGDGSAKFSGEIVLTDGKGVRIISVLASTGRIKVR